MQGPQGWLRSLTHGALAAGFSLPTGHLLCSNSFMFAVAQAPALTLDPDPPGAGTDMPSRIGRVLGVLRKLIDYGRHLATVVQQRAAAPGFSLFARPFGTADLAVILARITAGLHRAATLESRLCQRAARGRDLTPASVRLPAPRQPRPSRQVAPPDHQPASRHDPPRIPASRASPRKKRSPPKCVVARSGPSSSTSAATSALGPATATGHFGTNSATPSSPTAAASPASSTG